MPKTPIEELFRSFPSPDGWGGHYLEPDLTAYGVLKDPNAALFVEYDGYWRHGEREGRSRDQSKNEALLAYGPPGSCVLRISHTHSSGLKDQFLGIQVRTWQACCRASLERTLTDVLKKISEGLDKVLCPEVAKRFDLEASRGSVRVSARTDIFVQKAIAVRGGNTSKDISDYLEAEGFSKKEIELMIERTSLSGQSIACTLQPRIQWLLSLGLKQAQVAKAITTFPNLLRLSVERNLKPKVRWLLDVGLNHGQVGKAIATFSPLLGLSIEENLKLTLHWFLGIGLSQAQVVKAIVTCPRLLSCSVEDNLKPTVQWFLDIGLSQAQVVKAIAASPQSLGYSIEDNLKPTVQWFLDIGLSQAQVAKAIAGCPQILGLSIEGNMKPTVQWFCDIGLSQAQVVKVIAMKPQILGLSIEENLKPTLQWFLYIGLTNDQVVNVVANYPSTLGFGVEKNVKPARQWFLELGINKHKFVDMVASFPIILGLRIEQNLKPKQALLVSAFGRSEAATLISNHPRVLSYSYQRLDTRLTVLVERNETHLLLSAMQYDETRFAKRFPHEPK